MKTIFYPVTVFKFFVLLCIVISSATVNAQTFRIFNPGTEGPGGGTGGADANRNTDPTGVVTGIRFRVVQGGTLTAIHFYKGDANIVANTVTLWNVNGTSLGSATLPADAVSGWRTVTLTPGVVVSPGITYVVSVFNTDGIYAGSSGGIPPGDFTGRTGFIIIGGSGSTVDPANAGNGVVEVTNSSVLIPASVDPSLVNYWVDLSFTTFFPLPARLTDFNAATDNRNITLTWKTESEQNNRGFEIQRSNNGSDWYPISFVNGAGESTTAKTYTYLDKTLAPGVYYYKLKQMDFDGKSALSSIVTVTISGKGNVSLSTGLNPFTTSTNIRFDLPSRQKIRLSVFDINGREVKVLADNTRDSGTHQVTLDADGLSRQMYFVRLQTETETLVKQVVVK